MPQFCGEITQTPPAFCAVKINGRRAYELARKGEEVNIPERQITVYELEFTGSLPGGRSSFKVRCSKGTYVRSLGRDIARRLGTFGHLCRLRRTRSGIFEEARYYGCYQFDPRNRKRKPPNSFTDRLCHPNRGNIRFPSGRRLPPFAKAGWRRCCGSKKPGFRRFAYLILTRKKRKNKDVDYQRS